MKSGNNSRSPSKRSASSSESDVAGLWASLREIYGRMSAPRRRQFFVVLGLMFLGTVVELATIGAVIPFLTLLADPAGLDRLPWVASVFDALGATSGRQRLISATILFSVLAILAGMVRLQLTWSTQDFIARLGHEISVEIQRRILLQPYSFHIQRNTSTLLSAVNKAEMLIFNLLLPLMQGMTAAFTAAFILAALVYIDPLTATVTAVAFATIYLLVSGFARPRLAANSAEMGTAWDTRVKVVQESLGGIRDVIIDNSQSLYLQQFKRANSRLSLARANTGFIVSAPRFIIETVGMVVIAVIALIISQREGGLASALPIVGAVALGAQRMLPLLQQVYNGWSTASGTRFVVGQMIDLLRLPIGKEHAGAARVAPLEFRGKISVEQVSFAYPTRRGRALEKVTLDIPCGSTVAIVGETGSGKSTLADLLMGLLEPDDGRICVDGVPLNRKNRRRWQRSIAHVPQSIFLIDTTIARNIGASSNEESVELERVVEAAKAAQLHEFVTSLPDGYDTIVGERGIRLSGGQRQRLGIARAIYKRAPVLVLDEATSALDETTEAAVIDALDQLGEQGRTIVIIAHRRSTIAHCDIVASLRNGRLVEVCQASVDPANARSTP